MTYQFYDSRISQPFHYFSISFSKCAIYTLYSMTYNDIHKTNHIYSTSRLLILTIMDTPLPQTPEEIPDNIPILHHLDKV